MIRMIPGSKIEFSILNYPDRLFCHINVNTKKIYLKNGVLNAKFDIDKLDEKKVKYHFGSVVGGDICRLCESLNNGKTLNKELINELNIKGEDRCQPEQLEDSLFSFYY